MSGGGDPAYQQRGYPSGSGALNESLDLSASSYSASSCTTSGIASGEGSEGSGSLLHQRLTGGVNREQGVRDLRNIIQ